MPSESGHRGLPESTPPTPAYQVNACGRYCAPFSEIILPPRGSEGQVNSATGSEPLFVSGMLKAAWAPGHCGLSDMPLYIASCSTNGRMRTVHVWSRSHI